MRNKAARWQPSYNKNEQKRSKTEKKMGRPHINEFVRMTEIDESERNDRKNNDTWIKAARDKKKHGKKQENLQNAMEPNFFSHNDDHQYYITPRPTQRDKRAANIFVQTVASAEVDVPSDLHC